MVPLALSAALALLAEARTAMANAKDLISPPSKPDPSDAAKWVELARALHGE
jgi:hypothetical protein